MSSKAIACLLIRASRLAYHISYDVPPSNQPPDVNQEIETIGHDSATLKFRQAGIDACYFGETEDKAILAFRGTLPLR
jgi:hypothetical protein